MQIKTFMTNFVMDRDIQDAINEFIKDKNVIDIKISESCCCSEMQMSYQQTYMIIYE